jgi:hypothetical protein
MGRWSPALLLLVGLLSSAEARADAPRAVYEGLRRPKILAIAESGPVEAVAEQWRALIPADVTFLPLFYDELSFHHLCDKPLEERKEETDAVVASGAAYRESVLDHLADFDVIFASLPAKSSRPDRNEVLREVQAKISARVRAGGKLVIVGEPFPDTSPSSIMPCRVSSRKNWTIGFEGVTDHPLVRGLPFEMTGTHSYTNLCEAIDSSSIPLTRNPASANRFWLRRLPGGGQVVYLFQLGGGTAPWRNGTNDQHYAADRPDDSLVWNAFLRRLVHGLTSGDRAFPVLARIALPAGTRALNGHALAIPVDVENRSGADQSVTLSVTAADRRSSRQATAAQPVWLAKGERRTVTLQVTPDLPCADRQLAVQARVLDAAGTHILSESFAWIAYEPTVLVAVTTDRPSYRPGETIGVKVGNGPAAPPADAQLAIYLVDHDGRIVARPDRRGRLIMPDGGPELLSSYWVTAVMSRHDDILGTARAQVQVDRPWRMRDQLQWSVWTDAESLRKLQLIRDAGFNTLGFQGNTAVADRFGLRQYLEGTDINTFGVTIDHDSWDEVRAEMERQVAQAQAVKGPDTRSASVVSLGEESGFKNGWGTRYYWKEDEAPPVAQRVFDRYLSDQYGGQLAALNAEWGTRYGAFSEIPLRRVNTRPPDKVFVESQVDLKQPYLAKTAPYHDTYAFFDWYYEKYTQLAMATYRARRNPVPLSIMSAPVGFYPKVDVFDFEGIGAFYPKERALVANAVARRDYGDTPGFGLIWGYFDLRPLWSSAVLSTLLVGNSHLDFWVDVPLTFNADLTHTRASFWTKLLTRQLHPIEPILLHRRVAYTPGLGMFIPSQPLPKGILAAHFGSAINPNAPTYSALEESGYLPQVVDANHLGSLSTLVASFAEVVSPVEGKKIAAFVRGGGLLIATPWLASCSPHGNMLSTYPAPTTGLGELLGFQLRNTSQTVKRELVTVDGLQLESKGRDQVVNLARDVRVVARYADGTPFMLERQVGRGRVVYLNFVYDWDGWWRSFHEPARETYRRLIASLLTKGGRNAPDYFIAFESAEAVSDGLGWADPTIKSQPRPGDAVPWWASQLFSDPSGRIKYLAVFSDHRSPRVTARLKWRDPRVAVWDLMTGERVANEGGASTLTLRPGEAAFWALVPRSPAGVRLDLPEQVAAGDPIRLKVASPDAAAVVLDLFDPSGRRSRVHSLANVSLRDGRAAVEIPTAENDPPGVYRLVATESITRRRAERTFALVPKHDVPARELLTPFPPRAGEDWPPPAMTSDEFLGQLRLLRGIYLGRHQGLDAKYMLSYYLDVPFRPDNRHAILRRLGRVEWTPHVSAVGDALRAGETFYLTGEDLGVDPETGVRIDPFGRADEEQFLAALARLPGARRVTRTVDGFELEAIELGKGALVLCRRTSADRTAYLSSAFTAWQDRLKGAFAALTRDAPR